MAIGLRLRVTNMANGKVLDSTFDRFPVRIGRNPLSDLQLNFPFVSQFHAVLDLQGNKLMLTDLGSRNGTHLRASGRMPAQTAIDLAANNYEFAISNLLFQAFPVDVQPTSGPLRMRGGTIPAVEDGHEPSGPAHGTTEAVQKLRPHYDAYRSAWSTFHQALSHELAALHPSVRAELVRRLLTEQPALASEADFQQLLALYHLEAPKAGVSASRDQSVIIQAIKDLARSFVPFRPIENTSDIVCFLTKLQAVVDVFLKSFIPLRDGHQQFEIQVVRQAGGPRHHGTAAAVASAPDPATLAAALLDWKDPTDEAPRTVQSTFAAIMVHQLALLEGVMRGVRVLLDELSPTAIETMAERRGRLAWGPFRWESLWKAYAERHSDLADEEKQTFELIFGKQFAIAYTQYTREGKLSQLPPQPAGPWEQAGATPSNPQIRNPGTGSGS